MLNWKGVIQAALTFILMGWATPVLSSPVHRIIDFQGNVQVKKAQWKGFHQAEFGITLSNKDKIKLGSNAWVKVYCSDLNQYTVKQPRTYLVSEVCPKGEGVIRLCPDCNNDRLRPLVFKEKGLQKRPYLISPRKTKVFNDSLTIHWNQVPGVTNYKVKVEGLKEEWEAETNEAKILYGGNLEPGQHYIVTVVADNGVTSIEEDDGRYSNFTVLKEEEAKTLREQVVIIAQQELSQEQEGLILAYFYRGNKLNFEAIQVLEKLVKSGSQTATVYQLLGDTYQRVGLNLMAKEPYQQGLALTGEQEKSEVKAMMQWGLGEVEYLLGNWDEAAEWLQKARVNYLALGKQLNKEDEELINDALGRD
ncbi:MAG: hypothetical protein F6K25_24130 [Okeania sp. SIO2G4]|uniref:hypothetical protein n=1 Tax=unclassified Okeania TaxID=2634635 RepID=UPI0013BBAAE9|nr:MULTISPECIES: hypothetical protein [unclassified Okeania]NEP05441.1 hypothetical protein [Okeania sp. SIO4D6]NEP74779.1 hypothetical protein [Okeania sp. SIO2G5]NEP95855.1 hypothetical protein [Okeania sp. SIO2F5]NEQ93582.1 hypothetical protein [Okeania sp. SIO2G4]